MGFVERRCRDATQTGMSLPPRKHPQHPSVVFSTRLNTYPQRYHLREIRQLWKLRIYKPVYCTRQMQYGFMGHRRDNATASTGRINRLKTTAVIMCRRVHPRTYRVVNEFSGSFGIQQAQDFLPGSDGIIQPAVIMGRIDNNRHARMDRLHHRIGWHHDNAAAIQNSAITLPAMPESRECEHTSIPQPNIYRGTLLPVTSHHS